MLDSLSCVLHLAEVAINTHIVATINDMFVANCNNMVEMSRMFSNTFSAACEREAENFLPIYLAVEIIGSLSLI